MPVKKLCDLTVRMSLRVSVCVCECAVFVLLYVRVCL